METSKESTVLQAATAKLAHLRDYQTDLEKELEQVRIEIKAQVDILTK
jgi:hypothetical protein